MSGSGVDDGGRGGERDTGRRTKDGERRTAAERDEKAIEAVCDGRRWVDGLEGGEKENEALLRNPRGSGATGARDCEQEPEQKERYSAPCPIRQGSCVVIAKS